MTSNFLDIEIDEQPEVTIKDIGTKEIQMKDKVQEKCIFHCETSDGREIQISDVYVLDKDGNPKIQGLWWNGKITPGSAIYKLLRFYGVGKLRELVGKTANVEPDKNDFLILTTCKIDHSKNGAPTKANLFD